LNTAFQIPTSSRQFGFKKGISCNNAIHSVRKVVNYFTNRNSTVSMGIIDLKKAFDKTNSFGILCMLQQNKIDIDIINVLENWFSKNYTRVKWGDDSSDCIHLLSGVKQGGILSPFLFTLFVDNVLKSLEASDLGCFISFSCYNSFMYADDLILLSISVTELQHMFDLCLTEFNRLDLPINVLKCHCLRIGSRYTEPCTMLTIDDCPIHWVENTKYLGITLCSAKVFKGDWAEAKAKFDSSAKYYIRQTRNFDSS